MTEQVAEGNDRLVIAGRIVSASMPVATCRNWKGSDSGTGRIPGKMPSDKSNIDFVAYYRQGRVVLLAEAKSRRGTRDNGPRG